MTANVYSAPGKFSKYRSDDAARSKNYVSFDFRQNYQIQDLSSSLSTQTNLEQSNIMNTKNKRIVSWSNTKKFLSQQKNMLFYYEQIAWLGRLSWQCQKISTFEFWHIPNTLMHTGPDPIFVQN